MLFQISFLPGSFEVSLLTSLCGAVLPTLFELIWTASQLAGLHLNEEKKTYILTVVIYLLELTRQESCCS